MRSTPGRMAQAAQELYGESVEVVVPRLMQELQKPHRVAARLDVNVNAVRKWLLFRGWRFDGENWIAPETEAESA